MKHILNICDTKTMQKTVYADITNEIFFLRVRVHLLIHQTIKESQLIMGKSPEKSFL